MGESMKISVNGEDSVKKDGTTLCDRYIDSCRKMLRSSDEYEAAERTCIDLKVRAEKEIADEEVGLRINERRIDAINELEKGISSVLTDKCADADVAWCYLRLEEAKDALPKLRKKFEAVHTDNYEKSIALIKECEALSVFFGSLKELRIKCEEFSKEEKNRRKPILRTMRRICQTISSAVVIQNPTFTIDGMTKEDLVFYLDLMRKRAKEFADFLKDFV